MTRSLAAPGLALLLVCGCRAASSPAPDAGSVDAGADLLTPAPAHSSSIAISSDGKTLYVANADADSISVIDVPSRALVREVLLTGAHPLPDPDAGTFTPAVMPRALALSPDGKTLYVTGERSGSLYAVDPVAGTVLHSVQVGSEPVGVLATADGASIDVACSNDGRVVRVDAAGFVVNATAMTSRKPWALALEGDGTLLVTHLLGPGLTAIDPATFAIRAAYAVPDVAARGDKRLAHGQVRGLYDVAPRPGTDELWVAHVMLGTDTTQPDLDFESTVFPTLSLLHADGSLEEQLSTDAADVPGVDGAIADIVSGPHALAFTRDGRFALVLDTNSEDVLAMDADARVEAALLRPLPGHLPEGLVLSPDETLAFVQERGSSDVAVLRVSRAGETLALDVDGTIPTLQQDPMPSALRQGQHLFYSANSDETPITTNHWVACASCHLEGRSDAVTWLFAQGPRDTPTNAGGVLGTGFLFRTADRNRVQDYWRTIDVEQGGHFTPDDPTLSPLLDAIADYVNLAIPAPVPPTTDPALVAQGSDVFHRQDVGCVSCHAGPRFTDSGTGNPTLDLGGNVLLHDVGTCVTSGSFPDVAHEDIEGHPRAACSFDTPSLRGLADSAPYLHDGSAATIHDVLEKTRGHMGNLSSVSADDEDALVEYLRSL